MKTECTPAIAHVGKTTHLGEQQLVGQLQVLQALEALSQGPGRVVCRHRRLQQPPHARRQGLAGLVPLHDELDLGSAVG